MLSQTGLDHFTNIILRSVTRACNFRDSNRIYVHLAARQIMTGRIDALSVNIEKRREDSLPPVHSLPT